MRHKQQPMHFRTPAVPPPVVTRTGSWWTSASPAGFTATVEREHARRMKESRFGKFKGRPFSTDELSR